MTTPLKWTDPVDFDSSDTPLKLPGSIEIEIKVEETKFRKFVKNLMRADRKARKLAALLGVKLKGGD